MGRLDLARFYTYDEMEAWLTGMAEAHPGKMKLTSLTDTSEGRRIYLARLANFSLGDEAEQRGAYFVKAGVHAQETAGTTAAMAVIERILLDTPRVLDDVVFYVVPRVNPDGMELALSTKCETIRSKFLPIPGLPNAIIPCDINGDGMILQMRRKNPAGDMKELPGCPNVMVPRKPGDAEGVFYDVWCEGRVENYDGGEPVLGVKCVDFNRTQPAGWRPVPGGEYPLRVSEMQAVAEFEVTHHNIFAAVDFHCGTNAILRPPDLPDSETNPEDNLLIRRIGRIAEQMTGFPLIRSYDELMPPFSVMGCTSNGTSNEWNYTALGRSHYVIELGNGFNSLGLTSREILAEFDRTESDWMCDILRFHAERGSDIFVPWTPFDHPQLGPVEIGGFKGGQSYFMYSPDMEKAIPRTTDFVLRHAAMTPRLRVENVECVKIADGVYRVRADILNVGELSTKVMQGTSGHESVKPVRTYIAGAEVLSLPAVYERDQLRPVRRAGVEWFVRAEAGSEVTVVTENPRSKPALAKLILP